jgi:methylated-DNA-[protein]-cysteine S-methyltransferase
MKSPAYEKLNEVHLRGCIWFGKLIQRGAVDLVKLYKQSLALEENTRSGGKRKRDNNVPDAGPSSQAPAAGLSPVSPCPPARKARTSIASPSRAPTAAPLLSKIARSSQTDFQKRVLSALVQIPRGHHTTYAILARHLKSSARAVGNALGTNSFAPEAPCHRVLASGGGIGGFKGVCGRNGQEGANDDQKRRLLRSEGVKFDGRGRALGSPWEGFS